MEIIFREGTQRQLQEGLEIYLACLLGDWTAYHFSFTLLILSNVFISSHVKTGAFVYFHEISTDVFL